METSLGEYGRLFATAAGTISPSFPRHSMDKIQVEFITKMVLDELEELLVTTHGVDAGAALASIASSRPRRCEQQPTTVLETTAAQLDALADICYYVADTAARASLPLDQALFEIHLANMSKVNEKTGKFDRDASGKIIKPPGWVPPDIVSVVRRSMQQ